MDNIIYRYIVFPSRGWCYALCLSLFFLPQKSYASLEEMRALKENNAVQLMLQLMDQQQPTAQDDIQQWMEWERERLQIYELTKDWSTLIERTSELPKNLSSKFLIWARSLRVKALLTTQKAEDARKELRSLIWLSPALSREQNQIWLHQWRRQVIETYLTQGLLEDAYTAVQRFRQDYGVLSENDRLLRAQILLLNNHIEEAAEILSKRTKNPQAGMLYLIAQLRGGDRSAKKVLQAALRQMHGKWVDEDLKHRLWAVIAEAARGSGDRFAEVNALEHLVALVKPQQLPNGLFEDMNADGLWHAYTEAAVQIGNQQQLLIGDDKSWLKHANEVSKNDHLKARALYAFLVLKGQEKEIIEQAAKQLLYETEKLASNENLLKALFLQSSNFNNITQVPLAIRHHLVDVALKQSDIPLASRIMATMLKPPEDVNQFMWQLRRARILIMGGNIGAGYESMTKLISENNKLERKTLDRYLQVVFDLQMLNAHDEAVMLFENVIQSSTDQKLQRELYFWMADSRKAQENYTEAARWYLKSAMLPDAKAMDPWAQAARYQAASALAKAGLVDDARKMFQKLLRVTEDKNRVAVLKRELQQLRLAVH